MPIVHARAPSSVHAAHECSPADRALQGLAPPAAAQASLGLQGRRQRSGSVSLARAAMQGSQPASQCHLPARNAAIHCARQLRRMCARSSSMPTSQDGSAQPLPSSTPEKGCLFTCNQQAGGRACGTPDSPQDGHGGLVVPVVDDCAGMGANRNLPAAHDGTYGVHAYMQCTKVLVL